MDLARSCVLPPPSPSLQTLLLAGLALILTELSANNCPGLQPSKRRRAVVCRHMVRRGSGLTPDRKLSRAFDRAQKFSVKMTEDLQSSFGILQELEGTFGSLAGYCVALPSKVAQFLLVSGSLA